MLFLVLRKLRRLPFRSLKRVVVTMFVLYLVYGVYLFQAEENKRNASPTGRIPENPLILRDYLASTQDGPTIVPREFCHNKTFLVILVFSKVINLNRRLSIRSTWGNTILFNYPAFVKLHGHLKSKYLDTLPERRKLYAEYLTGQGESMIASVRIVFVLGHGTMAVAREAEKYNDIIQYDFLDTYNNLAIKTVMTFRLISQSCLNTTVFLFKCDDDTFVNVPNLLHFLLGGTIPLYNDTLEYYDRSSFSAISPKSRMRATNEVLYGHQFCNKVAHRERSSKWYMPLKMYPLEEYPKYLSGAGYLLSTDVAQRLYEASLNTTLVYLEDVFITGLCAQRAKIQIHHHPYFNVGPEKRLCAFKGSITQHQMQDDSMAKAWNHVSDYSIKCPPPRLYISQLRLKKYQGC